MATVASPPAGHYDKTSATTIEVAAGAPHSTDNERGVPPQPSSATPAMDASATGARGTAASATATPTMTLDDAAASTRRTTAAAEKPSTVPPTSGGADERKEEAPAAREERDIQDGCQSSAERNIWSIFNPMWNIFVVNKARLPKKADRGADWAETAGRPDALHMFLGTKNPVNRK